MFSRRHVKLFSIKKEDESNINGGFFCKTVKKNYTNKELGVTMIVRK